MRMSRVQSHIGHITCHRCAGCGMGIIEPPYSTPMPSRRCTPLIPLFSFCLVFLTLPVPVPQVRARFCQACPPGPEQGEDPCEDGERGAHREGGEGPSAHLQVHERWQAAPASAAGEREGEQAGWLRLLGLRFLGSRMERRGEWRARGKGSHGKDHVPTFRFTKVGKLKVRERA